MYERSRTVVRCAVGQTEEFKVEVGLHQGSALSPFLFAIVMDQLSEEVRQESPWTMMFADDIVICSESREQVEENMEVEVEVSEVVPCRGVCAVYQWVTESWSFCSINTVDEGSACGEGVQSRKIRCVLRGDGVNESHSVNDSLCDQDDVPAQARTCTLPCPDDCVMSPWSHWSLCPMSCDVNSVRTRQMLRPPAAHATCPERNETEPCVVNANCFTYQYNASGWSSCMLGEHAVCGEGSRSQLLDCIRSDGKLVDLSVCEE
ncbi:hypothetical protein QTP86_033928 [Hemibagrus guttatus]|nr:hypothetical protein QTP86_033928 [Hemibagrus guttatus]